MLSLSVSKTASKNTLTKTQVSKPKAAVVHTKVLLMLKTHAKETQVSEPKAAVIHAKVSITLRLSKNTLSKWFVGHA